MPLHTCEDPAEDSRPLKKRDELRLFRITGLSFSGPFGKATLSQVLLAGDILPEQRRSGSYWAMTQTPVRRARSPDDDATTPSSPTITNNGGLQVYEHRPGHVFPRRRLTEEGLKRRIHLFGLRLRGFGHLGAGDGPVGLDAVLEAVELPASVAHLHARLPDVDGDALPLQGGREKCLVKAIFRHPAA